MKHNLTLIALLLIASPASAQLATEDFEGGNPDGWGRNSVAGILNATGGNPGAGLELPDFGTSNGTSPLPSDMFRPTVAGHGWSGDFRASGINIFKYDRMASTGSSPFGVQPKLILADDNGTATFLDDAFLIIPTNDSMQFTPIAWETKEAVIDSQSLTVPMNHWVEVLPMSPFNSVPDDQVWNAIMQDVDYIALGLQSPLTPFPINNYAMVFDNLELGSTQFPLGSPFCNPAANNSSGAPTLLTGSTSSFAGSGLHLEGTNGPAGEFGYFLVGSAFSEPGTQISQGFFCLAIGGGNVVGRYNVTGSSGWQSAGQFDSTGVLTNLAGTSSTGTGFDVPSTLPISGAPTIAPGSTWHFQLWHRDMVGGSSVSNFSNGLSVTF